MTDEKIAKEDDNGEEIVIEDENTSLDLNLKKLREKLKKCMSEKEGYLAGWQRAKADFINARKEDEERRVELIKFSEADIIKDILPVLDSFENAFKNENWQKLDKTWQDGIKLLYNQLLDILKKHNIEQIDSMGQNFDPEQHESTGEIEVNDKNKDGIVIEEIRRGYKIYDKILRPTQVKIGKFK
ncbi:nucleotide exchange factor GrpE [Patescibacteria group bacterium]|nr:nucleotide exchange factor GrpE [Patescibacteria group bacterium]